MNSATELTSLREESFRQLETVDSSAALAEFQVEWLGRKGRLTTLLKNLGELSLEEKRTLGKLTNEFKVQLEAAITDKGRKIKTAELQKQLDADTIDLSLPGDYHPCGSKHPLSEVMEELVSIFSRMGFVCADGPEMESEFYNFEALNIPANHPARDMQDTFYIQRNEEQLPLPDMSHVQMKSDLVLLRTHTSPVQVRVMQQYLPPIAIVVPGRVYRHESMDATHSCIFHQLEGLLVDEDICFADLKGTLNRFAQSFFGPTVKTRFRPSFFPFTEPSAEVDISCLLCSGTGCRVCKQSGWLEMLGAGMVNPKVFETVRFDPEKYTGFAFGMGIERLAMFKYGVDDLRVFYDNDIRFLSQF